MKATNTYLMQQPDQIKLPLVEKIRRYVHKILNVFGLFEEELGGSLSNEGSGVSREEVLEPVMKALMDFRIDVRDKATEGKVSIMKAADELRDEKLASIGIRLEDKGPDRSVWSLE